MLTTKKRKGNKVIDGDVIDGDVNEGLDTIPVEGGAEGEIQDTLVDTEENEMPADRRDPRYSDFIFKNLRLQNGRWELAIEIKKTFEKIYLNYVVEFTADLTTIDWRIEEKKKAKEFYETQNQMDAFDDMKKRELEEYDQRIEALEEERKNILDRCPKISFEARVVGFKDKFRSTDLVFVIPDTIITELNDRRNSVETYKIELLKNLSNE